MQQGRCYDSARGTNKDNLFSCFQRCKSDREMHSAVCGCYFIIGRYWLLDDTAKSDYFNGACTVGSPTVFSYTHIFRI